MRRASASTSATEGKLKNVDSSLNGTGNQKEKVFSELTQGIMKNDFRQNLGGVQLYVLCVDTCILA